MSRKLLEIAASIVKAQVSVAKISPEDLEKVLMKTFFVLQRMQDAEHHGVSITSLDAYSESSVQSAPLEDAPQSATPKESIREDRIVCLECGVEMKQLTRKHLAKHGLTKWDSSKNGVFRCGPLLRQNLFPGPGAARPKSGGCPRTS